MFEQSITADERRRLDEKKPELIRLVTKICDEAKAAALKEARDALKKAKREKADVVKAEKELKGIEDNEKGVLPQNRQYTSLVNAAEQASCVEELELLIRYKSVKAGTNKDWKYLAQPLADTIGGKDSKDGKGGNLMRLKDIALEIAESGNEPDGEDERARRYHMELVKEFLGYLTWYGHLDKERRDAFKKGLE